jgi:phenylacetate-CoA ligase
VLVGLPGVAPHYQIALTREGSLDVMTLEVEAAPEPPTDEASRRQIADRVARHIKERIGLTCDVVVRSPGEMPRSQGKAVRVRDLRPKSP